MADLSTLVAKYLREDITIFLIGIGESIPKNIHGGRTVLETPFLKDWHCNTCYGLNASANDFTLQFVEFFVLPIS